MLRKEAETFWGRASSDGKIYLFLSSEKQTTSQQNKQPLNKALSTSVNQLPGEKQETQKIQEQKKRKAKEKKMFIKLKKA